MHNLKNLKNLVAVPGQLVVFALFLCLSNFTVATSLAQSSAQTEIDKQRQRLSSGDIEERRDALLKLGAMNRAGASREAMVGLSDVSPMIRAVAAKAILSLPASESVGALTPLLSDKDEFVRREAAYALGLTRSKSATQVLTGLLLNDKEDGVRAAAAVALGDIADEAAVVALATVLAPEIVTQGSKRKIKAEQNIFVLRAAAKSLGQIKSRAGVPALVAALGNDRHVDDVRREAAHALGIIKDPAALPALRSAENSADPYLARAASESVKKISP
jgi:HEAT repeat protein